MENLNFLLDKYLALFHKFRDHPCMAQTDELIGYWRDEILDRITEPDITYQIVDRMYQHDLRTCLGIDPVQIALQNDMKILCPAKEKKNWWFMTVGFDDKIITIPDLIKYHNKVMKTKNIIFEKFVIENFRKNDDGEIYEHKHIHYLIKSDLRKGEIIDRIFKKCEKGLASRNFVDLKNDDTFENKLKYILGEKRKEKLECVEMDKKWRQENNIPICI